MYPARRPPGRLARVPHAARRTHAAGLIIYVQPRPAPNCLPREACARQAPNGRSSSGCHKKGRSGVPPHTTYHAHGDCGDMEKRMRARNPQPPRHFQHRAPVGRRGLAIRQRNDEAEVGGWVSGNWGVSAPLPPPSAVCGGHWRLVSVSHRQTGNITTTSIDGCSSRLAQSFRCGVW